MEIEEFQIYDFTKSCIWNFKNSDKLEPGLEQPGVYGFPCALFDGQLKLGWNRVRITGKIKEL